MLHSSKCIKLVVGFSSFSMEDCPWNSPRFWLLSCDKPTASSMWASLREWGIFSTSSLIFSPSTHIVSYVGYPNSWVISTKNVNLVSSLCIPLHVIFFDWRRCHCSPHGACELSLAEYVVNSPQRFLMVNASEDKLKLYIYIIYTRQYWTWMGLY